MPTGGSPKPFKPPPWESDRATNRAVKSPAISPEKKEREVRFPGEGVYTGDCVAGRLPKRHGKGRMVFDDGAVYDGEWVMNQFHGVGTLTYVTGAVYEGHFHDGLRHGIGKLMFANSDVYVGDWVEDVKEGQGIMTWTTLGAKYEGDFARGVMHGQGTYTFPDGSFYKGKYVEGQRSGKGSLRLADGSRETGDNWDGPQRGPRFRPDLAIKLDPGKQLLQREAALENYIATLGSKVDGAASEEANEEWDPIA